MIYYLVNARHAYTIAEYLKHWAAGLAPRVQIVPYAALPANRDLPVGAYVFSDLERMDEHQRALVAGVADQLAGTTPASRIVNHPARALGRVALIDARHASGDNGYRCFPATTRGEPWGYPVFVRRAREHSGSRSQLLRERAAVDRAIAAELLAGVPIDDLIVVEFMDTADEHGIYRKYSAFRVGDRILPRHVLFSRRWMLRDADMMEPEQRAQVFAYCRDNPHERELLAIFDAAGIDYGRIDYALKDGRIQVWEINTNPQIVKPPEKYPEDTLPFHRAFADRFAEAFATFDAPGGARHALSWDLEPVIAPSG